MHAAAYFGGLSLHGIRHNSIQTQTSKFRGFFYEKVMSREFEPVTIERRETPRRCSLSLEQVRRLAKEKKGVVIPVALTLPADLDTPFSVYLKARGMEKKEDAETGPFTPSVLLESVIGGESVGRYSYICTDPKETISVTANEISITDRDGTATTQSGERIDPLKAIEDKVSKTVIKTPGLPQFSGGFVGYLGYEVSAAFEKSIPKLDPNTNQPKPDVLGLPEAMLFDFDTVIAYDHAQNEIKIIGNIDVGKNNDVDRQYGEVTSRINAIADKIENTPIVAKRKAGGEEVPSGTTQSNFNEDEYTGIIEELKEKHIKAGNIIQVVLSRRLTKKTNANPLHIYRQLRSGNPSPFMVYMDMVNKKTKVQIIGASPELLVKVEDRRVTTWPIAGTRPKGQTPEEDERLIEELKKDPKENAEHVMLVDLGRNDVGRISKPGTVKVPELMQIQILPTIRHLKSEVTGELGDEYTSLDALRSIFPAGTVSGAPKIQAQKTIFQYEKEQRGPYAGAVGYIGYSGNLEEAITIRTIVVVDGTAYLQAGGGIVYDSDPKMEWKETEAKLRGSLGALERAERES